MTTAAEYRLMADECFEWARAAQTKNARFAYLEIAKIWVKAAASRQDGETYPYDTHKVARRVA